MRMVSAVVVLAAMSSIATAQSRGIFEDPKDHPPADRPAEPPPPDSQRDAPPCETPAPEKPADPKPPTTAPAQPAAPAEAVPSEPMPSRFAHLNLSASGLPWTLDELQASIPPGTTSAAIDASKPIPTNLPTDRALAAALERLAQREPQQHEVAFRIAGAMTKANADPRSIRLLSLLQHHGIGVRADPAMALRTTLPLVRNGDVRACMFVASKKPDLFDSVATKIRSLKTLPAREGVSAVKFTGIVVRQEPGAPAMKDTLARPPTVVLRGDAEVVVRLALVLPETNLAVGRYVDFAGYTDGSGGVIALTADVPEPVVKWNYKLDSRSVAGGRLQLRTIRVTVANTGRQQVKRIAFRVRCYQGANTYSDYTQNAELADIAPGTTKSVDVSFETYNYYYIASSSPKADVTVTETEW